jgi:molecular chaperone GrpE
MNTDHERPDEEPRSEGRSEPSLEELEVWRAELERVQQALEAALRERQEADERALRARAELDTLRRRQAGELERARTQGLDSALLPVVSVHDDLIRALQAAEHSDDPSSIVPGIEAVLAGLIRSLEMLGLTRTGVVGEPFDAHLHEALMAVPTADPALVGTIESVFECGFAQGERLVRPARVTVYQEA